MSLRLTTGQFDDIANLGFEKKLIELLGQSDPDAATHFKTDAGVAELRRQCAKARRYGLTREVDVARYVTTAWLLGVDFDVKFGAMQEVLSAPQLTSAQKAEGLEKITVALFSTLAADGG
ncbi:MAG: hypothetical protein ACK6C0_05780 [Betaproteobacteria bacterium]|jgi:hypothetical protein